MESVGKKDFPHTVIGIASKEHIIYDTNFFDKIKKWKKQNSIPLINDLRNDPLIMITPPIIFKIYKKFKEKKSFFRV